MANKILDLFSPKVTDFRKTKLNEYDTIYEVTFSAEPMINFDKELEVIECGPIQTFYLIYNPELPAEVTMIISDLSVIDANREYGSEYWEENTNNILLSNKRMFEVFENVLYSLDKEFGTLSMFGYKDNYINGIHDDYIYGPMIEGTSYIEYLLNLFVEKSEFAKEI